jgi:hypothetical protein
LKNDGSFQSNNNGFAFCIGLFFFNLKKILGNKVKEAMEERMDGEIWENE